MNVDGINIYTKAHITDANDQIGGYTLVKRS